MAPLLTISDLKVSVEKKPILHGVSLTINEGELHAIMGPNGSGKSTLVNTLMGHPKYVVTHGSATFRGENLLEMTSDERARAGLFLAFQYPKEIAGVSLRSFLFAAKKACNPGITFSPVQFKKELESNAKKLKIDPSFLERSVNLGFSGGEKKKAEILQLAVLKPILSLLDETDSGLDVDALRIVAEGINSIRNAKSVKRSSFLLVTHYARILHTLTPDKVHLMVNGKIIKSGDALLATELERDGYVKKIILEKAWIRQSKLKTNN